MIAGRHFKNEDGIKAKIVEGHKRGICDRNGNSVKAMDSAGRQGFIAKPRFCSSSAVRVYVYREGKMVLKNG